MSILRLHRHDAGHTTIDNRPINHRALSLKARGLHHLLLSKPDGYEVNAAAIATECDRDGRDAIQAGLRELEALGYLHRRREQDDLGRWHTFTDMYELPTSEDAANALVAPEPGLPAPGNPHDTTTGAGKAVAGATRDNAPNPQVAPEPGLPEPENPALWRKGDRDKLDQEQEQHPPTSDPPAAASDSEVDPDPPTKKPRQRRPIPAPPEAHDLCALLADLIETRTGERPKVGQKWLDAARLLLTEDGPDGRGYSPKQVEYLIRWSQADEFWRSNILSMPKLREKRLTLIDRAKQQNGHRHLRAVHTTTEQKQQSVRELLLHDDGA